MKKLLFLIFISVISIPLYAQINLVPNPGFEENDSCFKNINVAIRDTFDFGNNRAPQNWIRVLNSPDAYKFCDTINKEKFIFAQNPKSGIGMAGFTANSNSQLIQGTSLATLLGKELKENLSVKLNSKLKLGNYYKLIFYVNLGNYKETRVLNQFATSSIGGYFSDEKLSFQEYPVKSLAPIIPQVINPANRYLFDTVGWDKIEGLYKAQGGEEWLTLGDFGNRNNDTVLDWSYSPPIIVGIYYFIDDVSVTYFDTTNHVLDTMLCHGRSLVYHKRPDWDSCIWYDGSNDSSKTFTQTGVYWVTNFYAGFIATDTIKLNIVDSLQAQIHHLAFCPNDSVLLTARWGNNYVWNNGATQQQQYVNQANTFYVTSNTQGCLLNDTFYVQEYVSPIIKGLQDTVVCFDDIKKIELDAGLHKTYLWQPTGETTRTILSTEANIYLLTVTDTTNCKSSQRVVVDEYCTFKFYVPNAFSPNGDG
nr:hypothetical protein [Bacteroidia bacterium]